MSTTFIEIDGGKLAVQVDGQGPLVICSPAMSDNRSAYGPFSAQFVDAGYRVVRFDLRGHGDSSARFNKYGDEATADDIERLIDTFSNGEKVIIAGASLSGGAATIVAGRRPHQVAGIILIGAFLRNGMGAVVRSLVNLALWRPWGPAIWKMQLSKLWPGLGAKAPARVDLVMAQMRRPGYWTAFQDTLRQTDHSTVGPWIAKVQCPVLVVMGDADPDWPNSAAEADWIVSNFKDAQLLMVEGAGHAPQFEKPQVVLPVVASFVQRVTA